MAMFHVSVAYFPPCHMSNLRNSHVSCHYHFLPPCRMSLSLMSHVEFKKGPSRCFEFRGQGPYVRLGGWPYDYLMLSVFLNFPAVILE